MRCCNECVQAMRSHGEKILMRPMDWDDCTEEEIETEIIQCDWCDEDFPLDEMNVIK